MFCGTNGAVGPSASNIPSSRIFDPHFKKSIENGDSPVGRIDGIRASSDPSGNVSKINICRAKVPFPTVIVVSSVFAGMMLAGISTSVDKFATTVTTELISGINFSF